MIKRSIYLNGFMGSGKTVVGKQLSVKLNLPFIDLDEKIEKECGLTISQIFKDKGEKAFREIELKMIHEIVHSDSISVVSLGGGTFCSNEVIALLNPYHTVYLISSIDDLTQRLWHQKEKRPLIAQITTQKKLRKFIRDKLKERRFFYKQSSIRVWNDGTIESIVEKIYTRLK